MPWVKIDDHFPDNRKVSLLSDRAFRLYISALCWSSANLTEGKILTRELAVVARIRGLKVAAKELETAGLWDPINSGWMIHDYLVYNPDRAQVQSDRAANAARQQAFRERKKAEREAKKAAAEEAARNGKSNGVTHAASEPENSTTATATRHDGDTNATGSVELPSKDQQVSEIRNAVSNGTPSRPVPSSVSPKGDTETASQQEALVHVGDRPRIPAASRPLVDRLTAAGMVVGWDLQPGEWFLIEALIKKSGVDHLVVAAAEMWPNAKGRPRRGSYFFPGWKALPEVPAGTPIEPPASTELAVPGAPVISLATSRQQRETDSWADRAMARAEARMNQQESS